MAVIKKASREILSAVLIVVALIVTVASGITGYLTGEAVNTTVICASVVALIALIADIVLIMRAVPVARGILSDSMLFVALAGVCISLASLIIDRMPLAADVYFIPVNHPASEGTALNISIGAVACYAVAAIVLIAESFSKRGIAQIHSHISSSQKHND